MKLCQTDTFLLNNFEGPLDLLWHLIQRHEIDIYEISLHQITRQFLEKFKEVNYLDKGAEFLGLISALIWFKSKTLLPQHEQLELLEEHEESDPNFEIIHQLVDYCRFKRLAKEFSDREHQQSAFYLRGVENDLEIKKNLGIQHLSLEDLASLFKEILAKTITQKKVIREETWRVSDKMTVIRETLKNFPSISFVYLFSSEKSREELIVTFLALLELMKMGELRVVQDQIRNNICIIATF
jgi:segregation and condensation protein A